MSSMLLDMLESSSTIRTRIGTFRGGAAATDVRTLKELQAIRLTKVNTVIRRPRQQSFEPRDGGATD